MPQSVLSARRIESLLQAPLSEGRWEELLFSSKPELVSRSGDDLQISVTPDRLDLLSEGGLALHLQGLLGEARGVPPIASLPARSPTVEIRVDPSVLDVRPEISGLVVRAPSDGGIDAGTLAEAIRVQEILHASVGRERRSASLGIYALERLRPPITYALEPMSTVEFAPLDGDGAVSADRFFAEHPMAERYGALGRVGDRCLVLRDSQGAIASLPPVLNSRGAGEVRVGDRELWIESTGRRSRAVRESLQVLLVVFAARGYSVGPVHLHLAGGEKRTSSDLYAPRSVELASADLERTVGHALSEPEVEGFGGIARLGLRKSETGWRAEAAPWRVDLLGSVDVAEDILLARGLNTAEALLPPGLTRGRRLTETRFRRRFAPILLGGGFSPVYTPVLVSDRAIDTAGRRSEAIRLANPPSTEFAFTRPALAVSLLDSLRRNLRSGYPQRISETGPVIVRSSTSESGAETRQHLGFAIAADGAGFADGGAWLDYLLRGVDVAGVREPVELPATIPGRAARVRIAGEVVGEIGEIHPRVLEALGVPVPVVVGEIDLSALAPLLGSADRV